MMLHGGSVRAKCEMKPRLLCSALDGRRQIHLLKVFKQVVDIWQVREELNSMS